MANPMLGLVASAALLLLPTAAMSDPLAGSEWGPLQLGDVAPSSEVEQFVRFEAEGRVVGHGGCNRFTGAYTVEDDALSIGPLAATRMACPPPQMALEAALFAALDATRSFRRERTVLSLFDAAGTEVAALRQRDWD